jgi:hypothetical protein
MKLFVASTANAAMMIPSMSWWGFFCMSSRSLKVPGSDSSALQTTYFCIVPCGRNEAFMPMEKPAPPRPRRPEPLSCSTSASRGVASARRSEA